MKDERLFVKKAAIDKYKIYWLSITKQCNNNCLFCLDKENRKNYHLGLDEIDRNLALAQKGNYNKIVISGGDPTVHPDLFAILKLIGKYNFEKVQIISNGRMFADTKFTTNCIKLGVDEFTLSLHSHRFDIQDKLYGKKGAGQQAQQGLANIIKISRLLKVPSIINIDIVINKQNVTGLLDTIKYYSEKYGVYEYDLLYPVPFGSAYDNKDEIFFDLNEDFKYIKAVLDFYRENKDYFIWLNRFPAEYLEGYEDLIQDPKKIIDEARGRLGQINDLINNKKPFACKQEEQRCKLCNFYDLCQKLHEYVLVPDKSKKIKQLGPDDQFVYDLPVCLAIANKKIRNSSLNDLYPSRNIEEIMNFYQEKLYKLKSINCRQCSHFDDCAGVHIDIIRNKGFKILKPIR
ncbi:MAG: radical SAM protein [Candidatus Parcubacteria bacterium]|nr:radical SAM protein [Candidatus Parcubacteria bacterium]